MKAQFKAERFTLIEKVKALRVKRTALKGIKGTTNQWDALTKEIEEVQAKIDLLSKAMGLPVKDKPAASSAPSYTQAKAKRSYHLRKARRNDKPAFMEQ